MKVAVLFSGGKDSCLALYKAVELDYEVVCLITIVSENKESYMFHTPSINKVRKQAEVLELPLIIKESEGKKEEELDDLEEVIFKAKQEYGVEGVVTGAVESVYQSSRVQKICDRLDLECFNPLWQKNQIEILREVAEKFEAVVVGVFAYPLGKEWLGRRIDKDFIKDIKNLAEKFKINPAGEGGEFESFVLYCPLFKKRLKIKSYRDFGEGNSWRRELIF